MPNFPDKRNVSYSIREEYCLNKAIDTFARTMGFSQFEASKELFRLLKPSWKDRLKSLFMFCKH